MARTIQLAGIDLGTTTICGTVIDARTGRLIEACTVPNPGALRGGSAWERTQDPAAILRTAEGILARFLRRHRGIGAIGVTGQMHGMLYVNAAGRAIGPLHTWEDGRGNLPARGRHGASLAAQLSARTGHPLASGFGLVTHAYNLAHGLVPRAAAALCTIGDYVAMRLANALRPVLDPSNAASLGGFDAEHLRFDLPALARAGLATDLLPEVAGGVRPLGLATGRVPVCTAIGDNQASFIGSVADADASALVNIGTGSQISVHLRRFRRVTGLDTRPFPGGGWLLVGAPLCGGRSLSLLRDFFAATVRFAGGEPADDLFERMAKVDPEALPGGTPPAVDARFNGTRAKPGLRGAITGLAPANFTPAHLVAAFESAVVAELHDLYLKVPAARRRTVRSIVGSGNAVRLNPAIRTILRRTFGGRLIVPAHREEAARGAAIAAGAGAGIVAGFRAAVRGGRAG